MIETNIDLLMPYVALLRGKSYFIFFNNNKNNQNSDFNIN